MSSRVLDGELRQVLSVGTFDSLASMRQTRVRYLGDQASTSRDQRSSACQQRPPKVVGPLVSLMSWETGASGDARLASIALRKASGAASASGRNEPSRESQRVWLAS